MTYLHHASLVEVALIVARISSKAKVNGSEAKATAKHVTKLDQIVLSVFNTACETKRMQLKKQ